MHVQGCVHYRIGSLENNSGKPYQTYEVHYRIGSLEIKEADPRGQRPVHYRIGSLEKNKLILLKKH